MRLESQLSQLGLFDARVPRYTSYPTAPHFSADISAADHQDWIAAIPDGSQISLYLHVPFCRRLCWFCACRTQGTSSDAPVRAYTQTLKAELALLKARLGRGITLSRLHWGGGTPTLLPPDAITDLARTVLDVVPLGENAEFSVEIDPNEIDEARLDALVAAGMNRASIGVQDFDPEIQKTIGRDQSYDVTRKAADMIRARGVASLNADILYGLPHQTVGKISESVEKLLTIAPDRVALYGYAHVPWMAKRQVMIPEAALPTPQQRLGLFEAARALFLRDGYAEVGIDHFARPTDGLAKAQQERRLRRNFQGYTDDTAPVLIGIGASSISRYPQGFTQNAPVTSKYLEAVRAGRFSTVRGHAFRGDDVQRARMIEALMCDFRIDRAEITGVWGMDPATLDDLFKGVVSVFGDMVECSDKGLSVPDYARPLTRMIARGFDTYDQSTFGHSSAI